MFQQPIVFVVGAGASNEYGMPVGGDLKNQIASAVTFEVDHQGTPTKNPELHLMLGTRFRDQANKYYEGCKELARIMPNFVSVDEALNWFSSTSEVVDVGRFAIMRNILGAERKSPLFNWQHSKFIADGKLELGWIPLFLNMVTSSLKKDEAEAAFRNVIVINFNYDRTIEHFLYSALQMTFGLNESDARRVLLGLKIIRPYGAVGSLEWQDGSTTLFGADPAIELDSLFTRSKSIKTYTEQVTTDELSTEMQSIIDRARVIVFLGFGFHEQNMSLLRAKNSVHWRRVFATVFGLHNENYSIIGEKIAMTVGCIPERLQLLPWPARTLLTELRPSIMAASTM
jgi:hypothetical protein